MSKELKFIHIAKCAGTSIENSGKEKGLLWGRHHREYGPLHQTFDNVNKSIIDKYDWFMVVRTPYERILSAYYCKFGGVGRRGPMGGRFGPMGGRFGPMGGQFDPMTDRFGPPGRFGESVHTVEGMNEYIISRITNRQKGGGFYTEQYKYLDPNTKQTILKFENLQEDFTKLMNEYNIDGVNLKHFNKGDKVYTVSDFSPELIKLINDVYSEDFSTFNYEKITV
jgi:hypothetical protein